ncbi:hypothetical protein CERZMDRAFT_100754 [Cercospora zeae-maydis SCOH1-5]|uniref:Uncharacterized protein n=1 Tax=Cercospora zeae-maydis SCOH1-5 TaxID=717836 RepID=A0A6A6F714_9PEZI|nr:hypothetical protein CERZMDRAFT_100754 [Cercospora zeae-maydis SCOH1-5]
MTKIAGLVATACVFHALAAGILATPSNGAAAASPRNRLHNVNAVVAAETCSGMQFSRHETAVEAISRPFHSPDPDSFDLEETDHLPAIAKREPPHPIVYPPPIIAQPSIKLVQHYKLFGKLLKHLDGPHDECSNSEDLNELPTSCTASPSTTSLMGQCSPC